MFKYLIVFGFLCSCVNVDSAPTDAGVNSTGQQVITPCGINDDPSTCGGGTGGGGTGGDGGGGGGGVTGMCGDSCASAADCGGSAQCRLCAGMPGTGRGTCLSGNPFTGELPAGMVVIEPLSLSGSGSAQ
jgi:hypothetical protein